jgi:putative ATPase
LYIAYSTVQQDVERTAAEPVPLHLRNAPTQLMKGLGYARGYQYAHDLESKVANMQCLPDNLREREYYAPTNEGVERRIRERMEEIKRLRTSSGERGSPTPRASKIGREKES